MLGGALFLAGMGGAHAADPSPAEVQAAFPAGDGLVVQVGAANGAFLAELTNKGRRSVHGLCLSDRDRDVVRGVLHQRAVYPLASVATWDAAPGLPYADRLVNLLIVDRDALGAQAPSDEECRRVVAPGGAILAKVGGVWKSAAMPRPATFANWTHFDGGADGNALSADREATSINSLQWIENAMENRWRKTGPKGGDGGNMRVWGRYAVVAFYVEKKEVKPGKPEDGFVPPEDRMVLECRDVNNGLPIWQKRRPFHIARSRWALAVDQGLCFTWLTNEGPLSAIDLATGEVRYTYPGSELDGYKVTKVERDGEKLQHFPGMRPDNHWVRVSGNTVIANGYGALRAWTLEGKPLWTFQREGSSAEIPIIDAARGAVYAMLVKENNAPKWREDSIAFERWPTSDKVQGFVALDLATGKLKWENTDLASRPTGFLEDKKERRPLPVGWGQLIVAGNYLVAFNTATIAGGSTLLVATIDPLTGKTVRFDPNDFLEGTKDRARFNGGMRCVAYRDGVIYALSSSGVYSFDPVTGKSELLSGLPWNARCIRPVIGPDHFLIGQTAFIGRDFAGKFYASARSGCSRSPVIGAGLILFGPHTCGCVTHLDGHFATTSRPVGKPVADAVRLFRPKPTAVPVPAPAAESAGSLITENWDWFTISVPVKPVTVERDGWTYAIEPQGHRIDATGPGGRKWSYVAEARIGTGIAVTADRVVLGSHDGWVHGLDRNTGIEVWRYLLAPSHRLIFANGMLTSTWPVFGVAELGNGRVVASAGIHVEHEGGIRVAALNAADGSLAWLKRLQKPVSVIGPGGGKNAKIIEFSIINGIPKVADGKVLLQPGSHLGKLDFPPDESEDSINARLAAGLPR
jgi:outer membrane protein assembly factor BamB